MEHASSLQSLRLRTHQFLTWLIGSTQTGQQLYQADRYQRDGLIRSGDDPDNGRHRPCLASDTGYGLRERFQSLLSGSQESYADTQAQQRQVLERHQREQQHRQQRGGWGHGR